MILIVIAFLIPNATGLRAPTAGDINAFPVFTPAVSTGVICTTSSTLLVATSTSRNMITISNDSGNSLYIGLGVAAVLHQGTLMSASSTITFDQSKLYAGAIYCISAVNSSTTLTELK